MHLRLSRCVASLTAGTAPLQDMAGASRVQRLGTTAPPALPGSHPGLRARRRESDLSRRRPWPAELRREEQHHLRQGKPGQGSAAGVPGRETTSQTKDAVG